MSSDDDELHKRSSAVESDDDDEFDDCDSGAGSDDFDLLELGDIGEEFCQVGDQTCSIPFELYDLPGLGDVLSMDVWNDCLIEEERFNLTKYLPDMDRETFMRTLKELFSGCNFHFGSPINKLSDMLKGGLCEPRVALYWQGLNFFQKRQHYHLLREHQNSMVTNLHQMRDAWLDCRGYSIEEKLRVLNIMKSQKSLMYEKMEELETDSSEREESGEGLWSKKLKDRKLGQKMGCHSVNRPSPTLDFPSRRRPMALEPAKYGKQNPKGTLKLAAPKTSSTKELVGRLPSVQHGLEMKSESYGSAFTHLRQNKAAGYDSGVGVRIREQMRSDDDAEEAMYEAVVQRDRNFARVNAMDKVGAFKVGKKRESLRGDQYISDNLLGLPMSLKNDLHSYVRNKTVNQLSDIEQFAVEDQTRYVKGRAPNSSLKGSRIELSDGAEPFWHEKAQGEAFSVDSSFQYDDWNKRKKWKIGRESSDLRVSDRLYHSKYGGKPSQEKVSSISVQNGGRDMAALKGLRKLAKSEETESDSSEQVDEDDNDNPLMRSKLAYPSGVLENYQSSFMKSGRDAKKAKSVKKGKKDSAQALDGLSHSSRKMADLGERLHLPEVENFSLKAKQKGKTHDSGHLHDSATRVLEDTDFSRSVRFSGGDDRKQIYKLGKNGLQRDQGEKFHVSSVKGYPAERRRKGEVARDYSVPQSNYIRNYTVDEEDDSFETHQLVEENGVTGKSVRKGQNTKAFTDDHHESSDVPLLGCNSVTKKRKVKEDAYKDEQDDSDCLHSNSNQQLEETTYSKKRGKRKFEDDTGTLDMGTSEPLITEMGVADVEQESKPPKKPFTLITPTVHTGFSFSIIHLLSAVRMAMITLLPEDSLEVSKHLDKNDGRQRLREDQDRRQEGNNGVHLHENMDINNSEHSGQVNVPSLTVHEIVNRLRSNPGDPCILETQEPLQDLVRGALKQFSSRTAPLGAKGWKPLVFYEKSTKSWSWIGPFSNNSSDHEALEEVTSPEAWGLPHKMLVKLVDAFANWLKNGQETLQQIGSLPAPPLTLMQFNLDEKERFRDLRAQKSLTTISPSSEEVRAYFRKEEVLRYSIPDRAFSYTAIDGRKSIVAPLRRCGGKPTSKARDHFMLKRDRPPHVTILCLVRDAAARLPGSIGTRADVCTLIRDSQYIVEDVPDAQVNQVVSGALDRLHYERDPCVQFDGERKLWVYLHREREEEDFEDDGTSSTKKWKRQKKDAIEPFDQGTVTVAYHGAGEQTGFELSSDLNVEPSCMDEDKRVELVHYDARCNVEDSVSTSHGYERGAMHRGRPMRTTVRVFEYKLIMRNSPGVHLGGKGGMKEMVETGKKTPGGGGVG
ncbi:hypothetical protein F0562_001445 [Nyssa sinensis]|uniref:DEUBAD domain-containing protein n=1 Tax=Nyssa sinensis TaxID=561372 RepID=A0A5J5C6P1_9ASTE|nr:hypothetical protein F0562_001445 [Nyssa sinensis]